MSDKTTEADTLVVACPTDGMLNRVARARLGAQPKCGKCGNALFQGTTVALGAGTFERHALKSDLPLVVDFWASWCEPCREENPSVVSAYNQFNGKNFTVLGVSLDKTKDAWLKAIMDDNLAWTQVSDLKFWDNAAAQLYAVKAIPQNFLLDPQGHIIAKNLFGKQLTEKLKKLFNNDTSEDLSLIHISEPTRH